MNELRKVVGTLFFENGKLLIVKPRRKPTFQMVGGKVEENETIREAAVRECHEELGKNAIFDHDKLEFIMDFEEIATSDPSQKLHMNIFLYNGKLNGTLTTSDEIESFWWFSIGEDLNILSNTLRHKIIPYALENNLIY